MFNSTSYNVTSKQVAINKTFIVKLEGKFRGASSTSYIQIHNSPFVPGEGAVPIKSYPLTPGGEFYKDYTVVNLPCSFGLYICISTTEGTKTLSTETMDLFVEVFDADYPIGTSTISIAEDYALEVWNNAAGPKKIINIVVTNFDTAALYILLFASPDYSDGVWQVLGRWPIAATGDSLGKDTLRVSFGEDGLYTHDYRATAAPGSGQSGLKQACYLVASINPLNYEQPTPENGINFYAEYK